MPFVKSTPFAREEAFGLKALADTRAIRCVRVLAMSDAEITLEKIESTSPTRAFWTRFGRELAQMHRSPQPRSFGFTIDNHIGATPQANPEREIPWAEYFMTYRLKPMCARVGLSEVDFNRLADRIDVDEPPSLVHGDLWNGNYLCAVSGEPVLIDPAPYRGHREVDLAMSQLFGGFAPEFYDSYEREYPLKPGYDRRRDVYNLYHLLNHWALFGGGYKAQSLQTLRELEAI